MPIEVEIDGHGTLEFPDGTAPEVIRSTVKRITGGADAPPSDAPKSSKSGNRVEDRVEAHIRGQLKAKGVDDAEADKLFAAMDAHDRGTKASVPGGLALAGGMFGGIPGAGLGAYVGHRAVGDDLTTAGVSAAANMAIPAAVRGGMQAAGKAAVPLVRTAMKPALSFVRRRAGIEGTTPNAVANRTAKVVLEEGLKSSDDAAALVSKLDKDIQSAVKSGPALRGGIDLPERLPRYLGKFMDRVEKQLNRAEVRAGVQKFMGDVAKDSPITRYRAPEATRKKWTIFPNRSERVLEGGREIRPDIGPAEGLEIVRAKSFFDPAASPGAQATGRVVERAIRDGVKAAAPETRPLLRRQGTALDAKNALEAMEWRTGNHDVMGLPATMLTAGKGAAVGLLAQLLKNSQMGAGRAAYRMGRSAKPTGDAISKLVALLSSHEESEK